MDPETAIFMTNRALQLSGPWWSEMVINAYGNGPRRMLINSIMDASDRYFEAQLQGAMDPTLQPQFRLMQVSYPCNYWFWHRIETAMTGGPGRMTEALGIAAQHYNINDLGGPYGLPANTMPLLTAMGEEENWYNHCVQLITGDPIALQRTGTMGLIGPNTSFAIVILPEYSRARTAILSGRTPSLEVQRTIGSIMWADLQWYRQIYTDLYNLEYDAAPETWRWLDELEKGIGTYLAQFQDQ